MLKIFKKEFIANLKSLIFWSIGMFVMASIGFFEYSALIDAGESSVAVFDMMPRIVKIMYGAGTLSLSSPEGYYACMFLWLTLIAFSHAILLGASIVSKEERDKTSEFLFTKPISRQSIITSKILVSVINMALVTFVAWISTIVAFLPQVEEATNLVNKITLTTIGMFITQIIFFHVGLFLSGFLKNNKKATLYSVAFLLFSYFMSVFIEMSGKIDFLNFLSPFRYFNSVSVMDNGLSLLYIAISVLLISALCWFSYTFWKRRDLNI